MSTGGERLLCQVLITFIALQNILLMFDNSRSILFGNCDIMT
jgi:hypothetical protein